MSDLVRKDPAVPALPSLETPEIQLAMEALQRALGAGIAIVKNREDGKTERAMVQAQRDIELAYIAAQTEREIASDYNLHERRLALIQSIGRLITENAQALTPEIKDAAQFLLTVLREEKA